MLGQRIYLVTIVKATEEEKALTGFDELVKPVAIIVSSSIPVAGDQIVISDFDDTEDVRAFRVKSRMFEFTTFYGNAGLMNQGGCNEEAITLYVDEIDADDTEGATLMKARSLFN